MVDPTRTSPKPVVTGQPVSPKPGSDGSGGKVSTGPGGGSQIIPSVIIPNGWSESPRDLARHSYFSRGKGICALLGEHGFHYVYPVMMDQFNTYLIRTKKLGATRLTYFVWDPIVGTIFQVEGDDLQTIVDTMGRSVLALDMVELGEAVKLRGADSTTTPEVPKSTGDEGESPEIGDGRDRGG